MLSRELGQHVGSVVQIRGWLHTIRPFGKINFLIVRDRGGLAQVVVEDREELKRLASLQPGSILKIRGMVADSPQADLKVELRQPEIQVEVPIRQVPPVDYYKPEISSDLDFILDHRPISLRNRRIQAVFRIQAEMAHAFRLYMHDQIGAVEYFAPNLIGTSSEGGAEFFHVDYFGYPAALAQSSQLYKQIMVGVNERVFALMPFFRAEKSHTTRHLSEGKQFEFEMGFFSDWREILDVQEGCVKFIWKRLQKECAAEMALFPHRMRIPEEVVFPRLTFHEAQELYYQRTGVDERKETDLSPAAEKELCRWAFETQGTDCVFITDWWTVKRPFYAYPNEGDPRLSNTFDLLAGGVEITSGGQRRHTYEAMVAGILEKEMDPNSFTDYLSIFQYGMPPHGGFGMGLERLTMTLLGLTNIREASLFPSDPKRIAGNRLKAKLFFGGESIRNEIIRLAKEQEYPFDHFVHEPTPTSADSARVRGSSREEGVKALILRGKNSKKNYQFNLSSHLKLDMKAVAELVGEKCEFESPEVIQERFGLMIGGVPPFGNLLNLDTFFDTRILEAPRAVFNCGLVTESIGLQTQHLVELVQPKVALFARE